MQQFTYENHGEYGVFKERRGDECPQFVLYGVLGDVASDGLGVERELDAVALVLVQLAVLVGRLSLVLEGDDDEADEDVDHEEGDDDDVDEVEDGDDGAVVVDGAHVLLVRVDGDVQDARPALEGGHDEEGQHGASHVVVVEVIALPHALLHHRVVEVVVAINHVVT